MGRMKQELLALLDSDNELAEQYYQHNPENDIDISQSNLSGSNPMNKIYQFLSLTNTSISIDEVQKNHQVNLNIHLEDGVIAMPFNKEEFFELANMRYRLEFPPVTATSDNAKEVLCQPLN
jgi:hypothetical protein